MLMDGYIFGIRNFRKHLKNIVYEEAIGINVAYERVFFTRVEAISK
jgi:hypothetical protein